MLRYISVLVIASVCAYSEEIRSSRKARVFSFNPEGQDLNVALDFSLPFIKIPFTKTFDNIAEYGLPGLGRSKININPMAIALSSMIIFFISIIGPIVNKSFEYHGDRYSKSFDSEFPNGLTLINIREHVMAHSGGCPERLACYVGQRNGNSEYLNTWKSMLSNQLLSSILNTTLIKEATMKGLRGYNCEAFAPCPMQRETLTKLLNNVAILTNPRMST